VQLRFSGQDVGHAFVPQARQVCIRDLFRKDDHYRIVADIGATPRDLAFGIEHDAICFGFAPREPGLSRKRFPRRGGVRLPLGELLPGDAAHEPRVSGELIVDPLKSIADSSLWTPAAWENPAVDAGSHQADHVRFHLSPPRGITSDIARRSFSIQVTELPVSESRVAIWLIAVDGVAPCQCFGPEGKHTTSHGTRIRSETFFPTPLRGPASPYRTPGASRS
jgi:hypothetical protein